MIKGFTPRLYQETILDTAIKHNTLIVLPTGLGKTNIFLMIAAHRLRRFPEGKVLLIGPTRPLIDQYYEVFKRHLEIPESGMAVMTGFVRPAKRAELWSSSRVIFSTPQGLENDILGGKIDLSKVVLLGFDEAHRAVGNYSYVWIAKKYMKYAEFPRIAGMTASPGSDASKIEEVCSNLGIDEIEVRTESDSDVRPYVQEIDIEYVKVDLPESFAGVRRNLQLCVREKLNGVRKFGFLKSSVGVTKSDLLGLQRGLHARLAKGEKDFMLLKSISLLAEALKASHALELLESQGITPLCKYFKRLQEEGQSTKVRALKNLLSDENFKAAIILASSLYERKVEHPKLGELRKIVASETGRGLSRIIVFSQYRDSALKIREDLNGIEGVKAEVFFGQAKRQDTGLSQKEQKALLDRFREGGFNVLVATSIGEEGLDIAKVDTVIFYEPTPSAIRSIQRRGRTGRQERGRVIVLIAKDTRDEAFRWISQNREQRMYRILGSLKGKIKHEGKKLMDFDEKKKSGVRIFVDHREKGPVAKELSDNGVAVELRTLAVADYLCSSRVAVEVKGVPDFVNSIVDGRLLNQVKELKMRYEKPVLVIQGEENIYSVRSVHPNAIRGMLAAIAVDFGIPVVRTKDEVETAGILMAIARREQERNYYDIQLHSQKPATLKELQEYLVASLPGVEATIAKSLLKKFGSVKKIVNATEEQMKETELIGDKKAKDIRRLLDSEYEG